MILVLFDCDGTLVDSQNMIVEAMRRAYEANGETPPPRREILSIVGLSLNNALSKLTGTPVDARVLRLVEAYKTSFHDLRADSTYHEPLFPGALEAVERLAEMDDVLLGVATGKSQRGLRAVLEMHNIRQHFSTLQTADDAPSKPHPEMIHRALRETGADVSQTVVIGDTSFDMEMARNANSHAIGVSWGYHPTDHLVAAGAGRILDEFVELLPALGSIFKNHANLNGANLNGANPNEAKLSKE